MGGGEYETIEYAVNILTLEPAAFACNLSAFSPVSYRELQDAEPPVTSQQVEADDV